MTVEDYSKTVQVYSTENIHFCALLYSVLSARESFRVHREQFNSFLEFNGLIQYKSMTELKMFFFLSSFKIHLSSADEPRSLDGVVSSTCWAETSFLADKTNRATFQTLLEKFLIPRTLSSERITLLPAGVP